MTADHWNIPPARTENQLSLQVYLTTLTLTEGEDYYEWEIEGRISERYSTGMVYTYLKGNQPLVPWAKIVWFSYGIPRHSFLTWLVLLDWCPTRDRLNSWDLNVNPLCLLCNTDHESRNHLFFECDYSANIWRDIARICDLQPLHSWNDTVAQLQGLRSNREALWLKLLALQATVYWIWTERNTRLHQQIFKPPDAVISLIDNQIWNRLQSLRHANPRASSVMTQLWFLHSWSHA